MVTLKQIRNFLAVSETLHFARAAEKLGIAPAVLSKEILKMEKTLGFQLFDRSDKRNICLTEAGKSYWETVRHLPEILNNARTIGKKISKGEQGTLSIAVSGLSCFLCNFGKICLEMSRQCPEVKFSLGEIYSPENTISLLENSMYDAAIFPKIDGYTPTLPDNIEFRQMGSYRLNYVLPVRHPLAGKEKLNPGDLKNYPLLLPSRSFAPGLRNFLDNYFMTSTGTIPHPAYEVNSLLINRQLLKAGLGIGIVVGEPQFKSSNREKFVLRPLDTSVTVNNVIAWKSGHNSVLVRKFLSLFS